MRLFERRAPAASAMADGSLQPNPYGVLRTHIEPTLGAAVKRMLEHPEE